MRLERLPRSFYLRPTLQIARDLPGTYLCRRVRGRTLIGRIVEVEAYRGSHDPASHAYRGRTPRNDVMFWKGGHLYVYFTYGMHFCANVVTEGEGVGHAVLLRAVEPLRGISTMRRRRGRRRNAHPDVGIANGPAKLCEAMAIGRADNGTDLCGKEIWIARERHSVAPAISVSRRIGIRVGKEKRWRFFLGGNPFVSRVTPP